MKELEVQLPPTTTHQLRKATFKRATKPGFPVIGVLTVREQRKPGKAFKEYVRRYAVMEETREKDRLFKLTKPMGEVKPGEDSFYYVYITAKDIQCDCRGFTKAGHCTHAQALSHLRPILENSSGNGLHLHGRIDETPQRRRADPVPKSH